MKQALGPFTVYLLDEDTYLGLIMLPCEPYTGMRIALATKGDDHVEGPLIVDSVLYVCTISDTRPKDLEAAEVKTVINVRRLTSGEKGKNHAAASSFSASAPSVEESSPSAG